MNDYTRPGQEPVNPKAIWIAEREYQKLVAERNNLRALCERLEQDRREAMEALEATRLELDYCAEQLRGYGHTTTGSVQAALDKSGAAIAKARGGGKDE